MSLNTHTMAQLRKPRKEVESRIIAAQHTHMRTLETCRQLLKAFAQDDLYVVFKCRAYIESPPSGS